MGAANRPTPAVGVPLDSEKIMRWFKQLSKKSRENIVLSVAFAIVFILVMLFWYFVLGKSFQWEAISPIPEPGLFNRLLCSLLVYMTFGAFLYWLKIYQVLYNIFVRTLRDRQLYRGIKEIIWGLLILAMYWTVAKVILVLNAVISFLYNFISLILYLILPFGLSLIVFGIGYIIFNKYYYKSNRF